MTERKHDSETLCRTHPRHHDRGYRTPIRPGSQLQCHTTGGWSRENDARTIGLHASTFAR